MKHGRQFLEAWAELLTLATKAQRKVLESILARAVKPLADLAELVDLASGKEELGLLTQLLTPVEGDASESELSLSVWINCRASSIVFGWNHQSNRYDSPQGKCETCGGTGTLGMICSCPTIDGVKVTGSTCVSHGLPQVEW